MKRSAHQRLNHERGQALVLIVFAIIAIFGFAALAIDAGILYSHRRAGQSAADAAAMSAAFSKCQGGDLNELTAAALDIASTNGFTDNSSTTGDVKVIVNNPPQTGIYAGDTSRIEVLISIKQKPYFAGFVYNEPLETTVRAVSRCQVGTSGGTTVSGVPGEVSLLALSKTKSGAVTNTGTSQIIIDGGVFVNSTADEALRQTGTSTLKMNWAQVRGGASLSGAFGIYADGKGTAAKQIDIVKDVRTSGSGRLVTGLFNIGGNVTHGASVGIDVDHLNVGGSFNNSGAASIAASSILIGGDIDNGGSGNFTSENMVVGGNITASGAAWFRPPSGKTQNMTVKGDINLSGSASIGRDSSDTLMHEGNLKRSGGSKVNSNRTVTSVTVPSFSVTVPERSDPLAEILLPPEGPTGKCQNISFPSYGSYTAPVASGNYYCSFDVGGSVDAVIPPGTYWVDYFSLSGAAKLKMDGVHLYITGKNASNAFSVGGSASISMDQTMLYLKSGSFSFSGASGPTKWTAPGEGSPYQGLALFLDRSNNSPAKLSGSSAVKAMSGTWYAPASACSFTGATSATIYSQFVCDTITLHGSSNLKVVYDSDLVYQVPTSNKAPQVSLDE
ncbi:MAG: hypothetical protein GX491_21520 [Chloroflexi bacterium]|nr:hypothetical protein [Chloroflexota bacterium]